MLLIPVVVSNKGGTAKRPSILLHLSSMHKGDHVSRARVSALFRSGLDIIWLLNVVF